MTQYVFTCPDCSQQIDVNTPVREATLTHGCPVCGTSVSPEHFAEE